MIVFERRAATVLFRLLSSLKRRGTVILPANVCPVVAQTVEAAGCAVVLVDIEADTLALDATRCVELVDERPDEVVAVVFVRTYGGEQDPGPLFARLRRRTAALLIDDCCLAPPQVDPVDLACAADVTLFSTGRAKALDLGVGGFAHCGAGVRYERSGARYVPLRAVSSSTKAGPPEALDLSPPDFDWGTYRRRIAQTLPAAEAHRRELMDVFETGLPAAWVMDSTLHRWRFNLRPPSPAAAQQRLASAGLASSRHYASLGSVFGQGPFPVAEALEREVLNLVLGPSQTQEAAHAAVECLLRHGREAVDGGD